MGNKTKAVTYFIICAVLIVGFGVLIWLYLNKPSADIPTPPIPPAPTSTAQLKPPVPKEPRISGDSNDDGLVDALDINALIVFWKRISGDYNLIDSPTDTPYLISALDLNMVITYWKCVEQKGTVKCPYIKTRIVDSGDASSTPTPTPTSTTETIYLPPSPQL